MISNSTIADNVATISGGAIFNSGGINAINNATLTGNSAPIGAVIDSGTATINNSILTGDAGAICSNAAAINGMNNVTNHADSGCLGVHFLPVLFDPALHAAPLADNGGATHTVALLNPDPVDHPNPAIDPNVGGTPNDQRGIPAQNSRDIGAYEFYLPVVEFADATLSVNEADTPLIIRVNVTLDPTMHPYFAGGVGLMLAESGTATAHDDYILANPALVTFNCTGSPTCTGTFELTIIDDGIDEADETLTLQIVSVLGGMLSGRDQLTITIIDNNTTMPTPSPLMPQLSQPEALGVLELPATGERPFWAELLGQWLGW